MYKDLIEILCKKATGEHTAETTLQFTQAAKNLAEVMHILRIIDTADFSSPLPNSSVDSQEFIFGGM